MPFFPPSIDDRNFNDLVEELVARIPAHTPEWTNPREGDPGRTLIELFAWLGDALLYRANLIPERQRLAFLRLLGLPMRPATPARGLVSLVYEKETETSATQLRPLAAIRKPIPFETLSELTVLPVTAEAYYKRPLSEEEQHEMADVIDGLKSIYGISSAKPYSTAPVFPGGAADPAGFDLMMAADKCLWLALLAPKPELVSACKDALGTNALGGQTLLNIGVMPSIEVPESLDAMSASTERGAVPHVWEITGVDALGRFEYYTLTDVFRSDNRLTRRGIIRLALPAKEQISAPTNDVRLDYRAGVEDMPPRLDAADKAERLVAWLRLRPTERLQSLSLSWVDINAVEVDQRETISGRLVGQSNGAANQMMALPAASVDPDTFQLQVEEAGRGYVVWTRMDDLALAGRDDSGYVLDSEAGTIRFGDGLRGRIPAAGARVRVAFMRAGGGAVGNLPPGSLAEVSAQPIIAGVTVPALKVKQMLATRAGEDAETLEQAEARVPLIFRHRSRAVTTEDYERLTAETPGVRVGRVEVLPRFKPQQRRSGVPGVVSVMVLPYQEGFSAPNPRIDRPMIEAVHAHLDSRRPLTTELYVIGCEYVAVGISAGITLLGEVDIDGDRIVPAGTEMFGRETVLMNVREAVRRFLWPLAPGGVAGTGWALGRTVRDRELEVVVARVPGVDTVSRVNLFVQQAGEWRMLPRAMADAAVEIALQPWQLPELLSVVVADGDAPTDLRAVPNPFADADSIAVPVIPKVC